MGSSSEGNDMASHERRPTRRVDQDLQAIGALTQAVLDASDIEQLLGKVAAEARTLVGAALGVVVTVAGNPGTMKFRAVDGSGGGNVRMGFEMPVASTLTELVLKRRTTFVARSASDMPVPDRNLALAINVGPLVAAPLADIGPARGVLVVAKPEGSLPFRPADIQLISTFAAQAASAIELFDLRSDVADLAARAERDRIARDLTGRVIDVLGDVELSVRALATGTTDARLEAGIDAAVGQLHGAITTVQTYVGELQATTSTVPTPRATRRSAGAQPPQADRPENELSLRGPGSQSTIEAIGRLAVASARDTSTDEVLQSLIDGLVQAIDGGSALINTLIERRISFIALRFTSAGSPFISPMVQAMNGSSGDARSARKLSTSLSSFSSCTARRSTFASASPCSQSAARMRPRTPEVRASASFARRSASS
jgi:hypothetical protein